MNKPRKVGQDMVIKKPLQKTRFVQHENIVPREVFSHQKTYTAPNRSFYDLDRPHIPVLSEEKKTPARGGLLWYIAGGLLILLCIVIASMLSKATISLVLQQKTYPLSQMTIPLFVEPAIDQAGYKTVTVIDRQTIRVPTAQQKQVTTFATGTVRIDNTNNTPVTLPVGTSVVNSEGKKFVTKSKITIPRGTEENPGVQSVVITAGEPGTDYNSGIGDFTVTGFPSLRARATTEIAGGYNGKQSVISESELTIAKTSLIARITSVRPEMYLGNQIPEGFLLPTSLVTVNEPVFSVIPHEQDVEVVAERAVTGILLEKENLTQYLEKTVIPQSDQPFTKIVDISGITYVKSLVTNGQLGLIVDGSIVTQAFVDSDGIKKAIVQKKRKDAITLTGSLPGVIDSSIHVRPFWLFKIPLKTNRIDIKIRYTDL